MGFLGLMPIIILGSKKKSDIDISANILYVYIMVQYQSKVWTGTAYRIQYIHKQNIYTYISGSQTFSARPPFCREKYFHF